MGLVLRRSTLTLSNNPKLPVKSTSIFATAAKCRLIRACNASPTLSKRIFLIASSSCFAVIIPRALSLASVGTSAPGDERVGVD